MPFIFIEPAVHGRVRNGACHASRGRTLGQNHGELHHRRGVYRRQSAERWSRHVNCDGTSTSCQVKVEKPTAAAQTSDVELMNTSGELGRPRWNGVNNCDAPIRFISFSHLRRHVQFFIRAWSGTQMSASDLISYIIFLKEWTCESWKQRILVQKNILFK